MANLTLEEWEFRYVPIINHLDDNASFQNEYGVGIMYETFGEELEFVQSKIEENKVWTYVDADDGGTVIVAGYSIINRIGYFITENAWEDFGIEIRVMEPDEEEEEDESEILHQV